MTELLYMTDSYLREWDAVVTGVNGIVTLDKSAFFPEGGGVPCDHGTITRSSDGGEFRVAFAKKAGNDVGLELDREGLQPGDSVHCALDWDRRYKHMRMHTAAHVISSIINRETGALITGNQIAADKTRIDFALEQLDREKFAVYIEMANEAVRRNLAVRVFFMPREEALQMPGMVKLANALPPSVADLRIVEIGDVDTQADGGPHVAATGEIGRIEIAGFENKGKNNRRMYYVLK